VTGEFAVGAVVGAGTVGTAVDLTPCEYTLPCGVAINVIPVTCKFGAVVTGIVVTGADIFFSFRVAVITEKHSAKGLAEKVAQVSLDDCERRKRFATSLLRLSFINARTVC
jgi:hypothetical protein